MGVLGELGVPALEVGFILAIVPLSIREGGCSSRRARLQRVHSQRVTALPAVVHSCHDVLRDNALLSRAVLAVVERLRFKCLLREREHRDTVHSAISGPNGQRSPHVIKRFRLSNLLPSPCLSQC